MRTRALDEREAREQHALRLAFATVRRFHPPPGGDRDDLLAAALEGAALACVRYDATRGAAFGTFALHYVRGAVLRAVRDARPGSRQKSLPELPVSLDHPAAGAEDPLGQLLVDPRGDAAAVALARFEAAEWRRLIGMLPERWAEIVRRYHYERHTGREIAADLGVTMMGVYHTLQRAYERLRALAVARGLAPEGWMAGEEAQEVRRSTKAPQQAPEPRRAPEAVR